MLLLILRTIICSIKSHHSLALENLALRHQLEVLQRNAKKPQLSNQDRALWVAISRLWPDWRESLAIVQPKTVVAWHRRGWRLYWRWKCRCRGRPVVPVEVRSLIRRMSRENPIWGAPRIQGELLKLGIAISEPTVAKYMIKGPRRPSPTWRTFIRNHFSENAAVDFFTCGQAVDPYLANEFLKEALGSTKATVTEVPRGIPSACVGTGFAVVSLRASTSNQPDARRMTNGT